MNLVVDYVDNSGNIKWGYVTPNDFKLFQDYLLKLKQQKESGTKNEILDVNIEQLSKMNVRIYIPDGTTEYAQLEHLSIVAPFTQYNFKRESD